MCGIGLSIIHHCAKFGAEILIDAQIMAKKQNKFKMAIQNLVQIDWIIITFSKFKMAGVRRHFEFISGFYF